MIIKKFNIFLKENNQTFGDYIEGLYPNDEYIKNIVNRFIGDDIDPDIRIANIINMLDGTDKRNIKNQVDNYLKNGLTDKDPEIIASVDISESNEITKSGRQVFKSFLKTITALGKKDNNPYDPCPDNFLIYYLFDNLDTSIVKKIFNRFRSLSRYLNFIDYSRNETSLYFGVRIDGVIEYGIEYDQSHSIIGEFKLNTRTINWILTLDSKSATSFKKHLVDLNTSNVKLLGAVKSELNEYDPGYHTKKSFEMKDGIITFGYYGLGNWNNGEVDKNTLNNIASEFNKFILTKRWNKKVLIKVSAIDFWVYLSVKGK